MAEQWANLGIDLHLESSGPGLRAGLTRALREAVRGGRLAPGTRLPSSRGLASDLGIARNTVAEAYADLVAEGWLTARQGAGTRVAEIPSATPAAPAPRPPTAPMAHPAPAARTAPGGPSTDCAVPETPVPGKAVPAFPAHRPSVGEAPGHARPVPFVTHAPTPRPSAPAHDLRAGFPDLSSFPRTAWLKAARQALTHAPGEAFAYGAPHGCPELRAALAEYLPRARGVHTDASRIVICAGFAHAMHLLATVLRRRGAEALAVEAYGIDPHRRLVHEAGLRTVPLPVDDHGADPSYLDELPVAAAHFTPAHQFPMGTALHPDRRAAAVAWARRTGGLIIEDDYDGEFRYDRQPVGALQALDPEHVVHVGTASKALAPGLRMGWMVLPRELAEEVAAAKGPDDWVCGTPDQLTLAVFMTSGSYDRQIRSMRLRYRRRRDDLLEALAEHAPHVKVRGIAAGLHAVLELPPGTEQSVLRTAAWQGLSVAGLGVYRHPEATGPATDGLVVGFGAPADHAWRGALEALCRSLN